MRHWRELKQLLIVGLTATALLAIPLQAFATAPGLSSDDASSVSASTVYYDANGNGSCQASGTIPSSVNLPQSTISAINALKSTYVQVGQEKNVPWQMLAAVDYRESSNNPNESALDGQPLGQPDVDGQPTPSTKQQSLEFAANTLISNAQSVYGVTVSDNNSLQELQEIFVAYNRGALYKDAGLDPSKSPYAMNDYDSAHQNMDWPGPSAAEPLSGPDTNLGAVTVYAALAGVSGIGGTPSACGASADSGSVVSIAQSQIGNAEDPDGSNTGPAIAKYLGSAASAGEPWCADFVSWVYQQAGEPFTGGVDGGWRIAGAVAVESWFKANGVWTNNAPGAAPPQPGDVVYYNYTTTGATGGDNDHVGIVESVDGTTLTTIDGNWGNAVMRAQPESNYAQDTTLIGWGRPKS